jgi:Transglycosylase SLT domain
VRGIARTAALVSAALVLGLVVALGLASPPASEALNYPVPAEYRPLIEQAAGECPGLPAHVLAAQLQAESDWNPTAVSPAGAVGIAQFMPGTWATWGVDANGNGTASPFEPRDAIAAQGAFMCDLLRRAQSSGLSGDPITLALAGYNAGWGAVLRYSGIPPYAETQGYVRQILATAGQFRAAQQTGSFADGAAFDGLPRSNPHTVAEAVTYATAATRGPDVWYRRCLNFVARAYGWSSSGTAYAIDHHLVTMPESMRYDGDRNPPPGALLFWDTGARAGHVALYLGGGLIATNDIDAPGRISVVPAGDIERRWRATYVGWSPPYFPRGA